MLSKNRMVFVCFNRHIDKTVFKLDFSVFLPSQKVISIREIIDKVDVTVPKGTNIFWTKTVKPHATAMYIVEYRHA
jgi:hypothetical protein